MGSVSNWALGAVSANVVPNASNANNSVAFNGIAAAVLLNNFDVSWMTNQPLDWWSADWISAKDGAVINNWTGRNGHNLAGNAVYSSHGVNGRPAVYFDGTGANSLTNSSVIGWNCTNAATIFVVFRVPNQTPAAAQSCVFCAQTVSGSIDGIFTANYPSDTYQTYWPPNFQAHFGGQTPSLHEAAVYHNGDDTRVYCVTWSKNYLADFWDGVMDNFYPTGGYSGQAFMPVTPMGFSGMLSLGQLTAGNGWPMKGYISEFLVYSNALPFSTVDQINTYLKQKAGTSRNTILLIGDSMIAGANSSFGNGWADMLGQYFPGWSIENVGLPGVTTPPLLTNVETFASSASFGPNKIAILWNDLLNDGAANLPAITNAQMAIAYVLRTNGWKTILVDPPSSFYADTTATASGESFRFAYQNWATNNYRNYFDGIVDLARSPAVGYSNACANLTYYPLGGYVGGGGTHWTNAAFQVTFPLLLSAIKSLGFVGIPGSGLNTPTPLILPYGGSVLWQSPRALGHMANGDGSASQVLDINGMNANTLLGYEAGNLNDANGGIDDTVVGFRAQTAGNAQDCEAFGLLAENRETGTSVVGIGRQAFGNEIFGNRNVGIGDYAAANATNDEYEVGVGQGSLYNNTATWGETAVGYSAGFNIIGPNQANGGDVFVGYNAGLNNTNGNNSIEIGNSGQAADGQVIRIGTTQTNAFIAGTLFSTGIVTTNGIGSTAQQSGTGNGIIFGAKGVTNTLPVNLRLIGFAASGAFDISNTITGWNAHFGSAPAQMFILQPGECVFASGGISEGTNVAF
jgi:hypothetical protein